MDRRFSPTHLGAWVLLYVLCAVGPRWVVAELPADYLNKPVRAGSPVTLREAAGWFPRTMAVAAGVTLAVGLAFGAMYGQLGAGGWLAARAAGADAAHPGSAWRSMSPARIACGVVGILLIVGGVVGIWLSVAEDQRMDRMDLIIAAIGGGIGVATGGAFHSRS